MSGRQPRDSLLEVLTPPLAARGLDIEDVQISSAGRRRVVRVLIDKDGGISLDDITDATRHVSALLDDHDLLGDASYTLEVTSPGVDRPLTQPRHWRRNVDRLVKLTPYDGAPVTGHIRDCDENGVTLSVDHSVVWMAFADIAKARVEIEFNRSGGRDKPQTPADAPSSAQPDAARIGSNLDGNDPDGDDRFSEGAPVDDQDEE